jgi:hypothetical protein
MSPILKVAERLAQFPGIDDPGTIGQFAAPSLHRTGNGKDRIRDLDLLTMVFQEGSCRIFKPRNRLRQSF